MNFQSGMKCIGGLLSALTLLFCSPTIEATAADFLVIAASPGLARPLQALGHAFETTHHGVRVRLYFDAGLDLRRTIAALENNFSGKYFIGSGPIHLIAPGGDELITRLEQKYYVLRETRTAYATESLVLVVPESLVEAPTSFEALAQDRRLRIAVADPDLTALGRQTQQLLGALGIVDAPGGRLDVATDVRGILDHLLSGQADVGILYGPDAAINRERVRVVAVAPERLDRPIMHSIAMERYCPNRQLCEEFLGFVRSAEARKILTGLGYGLPNGKSAAQ